MTNKEFVKSYYKMLGEIYISVDDDDLSYNIINKNNMKCFKNKYFTKRDYECTNVVYCVGIIPPDDNFIECDFVEIINNRCTQIGVKYDKFKNDVVYFGYL